MRLNHISSIQQRLHFLFIHALIRGILAGLPTVQLASSSKPKISKAST